jgi:hypothetical protein
MPLALSLLHTQLNWTAVTSVQQACACNGWGVAVAQVRMQTAQSIAVVCRQGVVDTLD